MWGKSVDLVSDDKMFETWSILGRGTVAWV